MLSLPAVAFAQNYPVTNLARPFNPGAFAPPVYVPPPPPVYQPPSYAVNPAPLAGGTRNWVQMPQRPAGGSPIGCAWRNDCQ